MRGVGGGGVMKSDERSEMTSLLEVLNPEDKSRRVHKFGTLQSIVFFFKFVGPYKI